MQLERSEIRGLLLAFAAAALALGVALVPRHKSASLGPALQAAPSWCTKSDLLLLIELPDTGGFLANGAPLDPAELPADLQQVLRYHPDFPHCLFIRTGAARPEGDVQIILNRAATVGWQVFDAAKSGLPTVHSPSDSLLRARPGLPDPRQQRPGARGS